jgi:hypothetical protein
MKSMRRITGPGASNPYGIPACVARARSWDSNSGIIRPVEQRSRPLQKLPSGPKPRVRGLERSSRIASRRRRRGREAVSGPPDALQDLALFLVGDVVLDPGVLAQLRAVPAAPQLGDRGARALGRHR